MNNYPLIKFTLLFICGYLIQEIFQFSNNFLLYLSISLIIISLTTYYFARKSFNSFNVFLIILTIIVIGSTYYSFSYKSKVYYPFNLPKYHNALITGKILNVDLIKEDRLTFIIESNFVIINDTIDKRQIRFFCSLIDKKTKLNKLYDSICIGNRVKINGVIIKPRNKRNFGEFDYESYLNSRQVHALLNIYNVSDVKIITHSVNTIKNIIFSIRKKVDEHITALHNKSTSSLLRGLLLADRSLIDYDVKTEFINTGVVHVLAVSGLHVGYISLIFIILFQRLNIYLKYSLTILGLILFMLITNSPPSVTRATIMAIVVIISILMGRKYYSLNAVALSALFILILNPNELFEPGFQLSFAAVISIVTFYPPLKEIISKLNLKSQLVKNIILFSLTSIAAQIGTFPFVLVYFYKLSIISIFSNLIVIPLIGLIIALGILTIFLSLISLVISSFYAASNELLTYFLFLTINKLNNLPFAYVPIRQFNFYDALLFYICLLFSTQIWKGLNSAYSRFIVIILLLLNFYIWSKVNDSDYLPDKILSVLAIDVGQGDSYLIKFPDGKTTLIDAGNASKIFDSGKRIIIPLLERLGIKKIDYGLVSHVDADHYRGFYSIIKERKVNFIFKPVPDSLDREDIYFEKYLRTNSIPFKYYTKNVLKIGGARLYIINNSDIVNNKYLDSNERSGVIKLVYGKTSFLFTGDINSKIEKELINNYKNFLNSDVLKVSHHGSKTGTSEIFLDVVKPEFAIISAGVSNQFRHPHKEVLERIKKRNIKIFRTDLEGSILFHSDGYNISNIDWKKLDNSFIF